MIHDTIANANLYQGLHSGIHKGLKFLANFDPATPDSRIDIDGDDVFALVQSYQTTPSEEKRFEGHRVYADIQYIVSGDEIIVSAPVSRLTPETEYDSEKDFLLYSDTDDAIDLILRPGDFTIFLPDDAHKPGCHHKGESSVKKVVVKVRL